MNKLKFVLILITRIRLVLSQTTQTVFQALNDNRCFSTSSNALAIYAPIDLNMCSYMCYKNDFCALISYIRSNSTCFFYSSMTKAAYASATVSKPGICDSWVLTWGGSIIFTANVKYVVPPGVTNLKILAVGGGGGGSDTNAGGGGSGYVTYQVLTVKPGDSYPVTIGPGGKVNGDGGKTTLGTKVTALGGLAREGTGGCNGGPGGSGGGAGCPTAAGTSGNGGSSGNNGTDGVSTTGNAGKGQGATFTSYFSQFVMNTLSTGQGAAGFTSTATVLAGGGGGGGVLFNGDGPNSTNGGCFISGVWNGPGPSIGYGAGGSGGCLINNLKHPGGEGADGLMYIEFS